MGDSGAAAPEPLEPIPGLETTSLTDGMEFDTGPVEPVPVAPLHSFVGQEEPDLGMEPSGLELDTTPAETELTSEYAESASDQELEAALQAEPEPELGEADLWAEAPVESAAEPEQALSIDDLDAFQPEEAAPMAPFEEAPAEYAPMMGEAAPEQVDLPEPGLAFEEELPGAATAVPAAVAAAAEAVSAAVLAGMSKEELSELIREMVEKVVWEVVPALAEAMIEERLLQMEQAQAS